MDEDMICLLHLLGFIFGDQFWSQTVFILTKLPMNEKEIKKREKNSDDEAREFPKSLIKKFPTSCRSNFLILDAHYDETDEFEKKSFLSSLDVLQNMITRSSGLKSKSGSEEALLTYMETTKEDTRKKLGDEKHRKLLPQAEIPEYNIGLETLWGELALRKLRSYIFNGKMSKVPHIENFAKCVNLQRIFDEFKEQDAVELFERLLEEWYDEDLFELDPVNAQNKLSLAIENSRCAKRVKTDITRSMAELP